MILCCSSESDDDDDGMPSLEQDFGGLSVRPGSCDTPSTIGPGGAEAAPDLPLGEGCAFVCQALANSSETVMNIS